MTRKTFKIIIYTFIITALIYKYGFKTYLNYQAHNQAIVLYQSISEDGMPWINFGHSTLGNSIYLFDSGGSEEVTLIVGGIHGNEFGSIDLAYKLARFLNDDASDIKKRVIILPILNPDGLLADTRTNSTGVDIDKNFPSRNWSPVYQDDDAYPGNEPASEKETLIFMEVLNRYKFKKIISLHSSENNISYGGPAQGLANKISQSNGYEITFVEQNGGSIEDYMGRDINIPCVKINLPDYNPESHWLKNKVALINAINY